MAFGPRINLDIDDLVRRYRAGETPKEIAATVPASAETVRRRLRERGATLLAGEATRRYFQRPEAIAQARAAQQMGVKQLRRDDVDNAALIKDYLAGATQRAVARQYGIAQPTVRRILSEAGIPIRGWSEAGILRVADQPEDVRRVALARLAAARPLRQTPESLAATAAQKYRSLSQLMGPDEDKVLLALVQAGFEVDRQTAVDRYNLDLTVEHVDIEVHRNAHGPHLNRQGRIYPRVDYLTDRGWRVLYVWCPRGFNPNDLEQVVAWVERLRSAPARPGEYVVLRCYGETAPARGGDTYKGAFVVSTRGGHRFVGGDRRIRRHT